MTFKTKMLVPFHLGDPVGILFYGHIFQLAHQAIEQLMIESHFSWKNWFEHEEWGAPAKYVDCEYFKPIRPGQSYDVELILSKNGSSSLKFKISFREDQTTVAQVTQIHVFINRKTFKKIPIPEAVKKHFQL